MECLAPKKTSKERVGKKKCIVYDTPAAKVDITIMIKMNTLEVGTSPSLETSYATPLADQRTSVKLSRDTRREQHTDESILRHTSPKNVVVLSRHTSRHMSPKTL